MRLFPSENSDGLIEAPDAAAALPCVPAFPSENSDGLIEAATAGLAPVWWRKFPSENSDGLIEAAERSGPPTWRHPRFPSENSDGLIEAFPIRGRFPGGSPRFPSENSDGLIEAPMMRQLYGARRRCFRRRIPTASLKHGGHVHSGDRPGRRFRRRIPTASLKLELLLRARQVALGFPSENSDGLIEARRRRSAAPSAPRCFRRRIPTASLKPIWRILAHSLRFSCFRRRIPTASLKPLRTRVDQAHRLGHVSVGEFRRPH